MWALNQNIIIMVSAIAIKNMVVTIGEFNKILEPTKLTVTIMVDRGVIKTKVSMIISKVELFQDLEIKNLHSSNNKQNNKNGSIFILMTIKVVSIIN
jgi:hypothetical protein